MHSSYTQCLKADSYCSEKGITFTQKEIKRLAVEIAGHIRSLIETVYKARPTLFGFQLKNILSNPSRFFRHNIKIIRVLADAKYPRLGRHSRIPGSSASCRGSRRPVFALLFGLIF